MGVGENGTQLYVYDVKNAKAVELSDHLNSIFTGRTSGGGSSSGNVAPGLKPVTIGALGGSGGAGGVGGSMSATRFNPTNPSAHYQGQNRPPTGSTTATGAPGGANVSTTGAGAGAGGAGGNKETDIRITPI